jgi:hypothetical protein
MTILTIIKLSLMRLQVLFELPHIGVVSSHLCNIALASIDGLIVKNETQVFFTATVIEQWVAFLLKVCGNRIGLLISWVWV